MTYEIDSVENTIKKIGAELDADILEWMLSTPEAYMLIMSKRPIVQRRDNLIRYDHG